MAMKWTTAAPGVRYREHPDRRQRNGRPDRYYAIRYYDANGKQREEGLGWATDDWSVDKAQGILAKLKEAARTGTGPRTLAELRAQNSQRRMEDSDSADTITLAQFFDDYYTPAAKKRKRTWSHDVGRFDKGIRESLGDVPIRGLSKDHLEELMDALRSEGLAESTVLQYIAVMRQVFSLARITMIDGAPLWSAGITPVDEIILPGASEERERFLQFAEADALIDAAKNLEVDATYLPHLVDLVDLIKMGLNTGLRFGELIRLEWADVSLVNAFLIVRAERHRKTGGRVPLNTEVLQVLRDRNKRRLKGETLVFSPERAGKGGYTLRRLYMLAVDACELNKDSTSARDKVVFHTLRHTFGSWLAMAGTDIYRIKTLMRHKTIKMTMRYAHLLPDATRDAVENLRPQTTAHED